MASSARRPERRQEPLSRERIVTAAVELLDTAGESGLTFRALAERLATGPGAIYWHVTGKGELLAAATDAVLGTALAEDPGASPRDAVRTLALGVFDALDVHPWVGAHLVSTESHAPTLPLFERVGRQVRALGVPESAWFTAASTLLNYILGVAGQNAANTRRAAPGTDRAAHLGGVADAWSALDPAEYAFTRSVAGQVRDHDDRAEFAAGIDLILDGITALSR
ncbi:TetR family transcriptional regulator [Streptomyces sp. NPDC005840]|jgi:AcrR family transcriptional regulator|uniref:TetR family transcriptional regulator n=1 Tax=Streptomyces doudnae TaxID=3075536 RepID=A0ABD5F230_9ACTN|nr:MULTISPECIES: TetR family transcriptional regulator [unclassified Streptomyces]MDT0440472.1 TetR family transcriptional regulator [Streptomyces sp. DSM 41981]MYQ66853.1 TetR family transcriptional regulator [Streptomyces sp. SID4950]SCE26333.1 transcriptional regulator, TetR family [Streptomyces sp. SolWspMP-5a-2]